MTLQDVNRIFSHWKRNPPLRVLVASCAAALGVKLPEPEEGKPKPMGIQQARAWAAAANKAMVEPNG